MQGNKLYVGNFSHSTDNSQLEELFSPHGKVQSANVIRNKGFGFVEMLGTSEAKKAQEVLDGSKFGGRTLKVIKLILKKKELTELIEDINII
jgi:RNA recognition motif-containing protein